MNFTVKHIEQVTIITANILKLDGSVSDEFRNTFAIINDEGGRNMVLDLSKTEYLNEIGMNDLSFVRNLCNNSKGSFVLSCVRTKAMTLINLLASEDDFIIVPTVDEAVDLIYMEEQERELGFL